MATNIDYWARILENPTPSYAALFEEEKRFLHANVRSNTDIVEVCCGDGRNMESVASFSRNVTGVDIDLFALQKANNRLLSFLNTDFVVGDALSLPFQSHSFDSAVLFDTLINLQAGKIQALMEMGRVIKNDGNVILSIYSEDALNARLEAYQKILAPIERVENGKVVVKGGIESEQFSLNEIQEMAHLAGLQVVQSVKVEHLSYLLELKK